MLVLDKQSEETYVIKVRVCFCSNLDEKFLYVTVVEVVSLSINRPPLNDL